MLNIYAQKPTFGHFNSSVSKIKKNMFRKKIKNENDVH